MQTLIVSLDKKCTSTARMLSISQQCTEQLRSDTDAKIDKLTQELQSQTWEIKKLFEVMSTRIAAVEQKAAELPVIQKRLDDGVAITKVVVEDIQKLSAETDEKISTFGNEIKQFESNQLSILADVESLKTADSKLQFDLTESERKYQNLLENTVEESKEDIAMSEDKTARNIHIATTKIAGEMELLQVEMTAKEAGCMAAVRLLGESLREDTLKIKDTLENHMKGVGKELNTSIENHISRVNRSLADQVEAINDEIENQKRKISSLNENNRVQFKQIDRTVGSLAKDQEDLFNSVNSMSYMDTTMKMNDVKNGDQLPPSEDDEESFSIHSAAKSAAGVQRRALNSFARGDSFQSQSQTQNRINKGGRHTLSTPSNVSMTLHDDDECDSDGLKYIGSGLYVDDVRPTSPLYNIRDSENNIVSDIKPRRQQSKLYEKGQSIERVDHKIDNPQSRATQHNQHQQGQRQVQEKKHQQRSDSLQQHVEAQRQPELLEQQKQQQQQQQQQLKMQQQQQQQQQQLDEWTDKIRDNREALPPPPPSSFDLSPSPKSKRRAPPSPNIPAKAIAAKNTTVQSQTQQNQNFITQQNPNVPNQSYPANNKTLNRQFSAPVTSGFAHFIKTKHSPLPGVPPTIKEGEPSWKDVLIEKATLENRPPWIPNSTTPGGSMRRAESMPVYAAHNGGGDDKTASSTISDLHSHPHHIHENHEKMLPERRHFDNTAHLKGPSAHL
jgi:hypothetical protein